MNRRRSSFRDYFFRAPLYGAAYCGRVVLVGILVLYAGLSARTAMADWPVAMAVGHRPGTYFWCPGSALDEKNVDEYLATLWDGGLGTVHIVPIYGAKEYEDRAIPFLSPQWVKMFDYTVRKAEALGMNVDLTTGTGWCFGGPSLAPEHRATKVEYEDGRLVLVQDRKVKRAAPGGEGFMLDPYSPKAMRAYLERFSKAFDEGSPALPRAQYHDSFEYGATWSDELLEAFKAQRGYDLEARLPLFFDDTDQSETRARLKYDYRLTLDELHLAFLKIWVDWSHERGMLTRNEAHGGPYNLLDAYALSDIPETEMFGAPDYPIPGFRREEPWVRDPDDDRRVTMMAASAAHVAHKPGQQRVSSETCTWLRDHWHTTLGQMKLQIDGFFLAGVNHIFYHGTCYSPKDVPWPGWFFYAATKADPRNAFWKDVDLLNTYVTRCQSLLQAGRPGHDVLLYWPIHDAWMDPKGMAQFMNVHSRDWMTQRPVGAAAQRLLEEGFCFDFVSDRLLRALKVNKGKLCAPGGEYMALVLPECHYVPAATLDILADLAEAGAPVIFEAGMPQDVPGLARIDEGRARFAKARERLEGSSAVIADELTAALKAAGVRRETLVDQGLETIRRFLNGRRVYFIVNQSGKPFDGWLPLACSSEDFWIHDPMTGASGALAVRQAEESSCVRLQIRPGESIFVREGSTVSAKPWVYWEEAGTVIDVSGEWRVDFVDGEPCLPETYRTDRLASWTGALDERAQAFAGTARYTVNVRIPGDVEADDWLLDLGDVRESARVRVNGEEAGFAFALPFQVRLGGLLKPGENILEVEVTNLSANRIRDLDQSKAPWKIMRDINIVNVDYKAFIPAHWPLMPSGLLGPVRLVPLKRVRA